MKTLRTAILTSAIFAFSQTAAAEEITFSGVLRYAIETRFVIPGIAEALAQEEPVLIIGRVDVSANSSYDRIDSYDSGFDVLYGGSSEFTWTVFDVALNVIDSGSAINADREPLRTFVSTASTFSQNCIASPPADDPEALCQEMVIGAGSSAFDGVTLSERGAEMRVYGANLFGFSDGVPTDQPDFPETLSDPRITRSFFTMGQVSDELRDGVWVTTGRAHYDFRLLEFCSKDLGPSGYAACLKRMKDNLRLEGLSAKAVGVLQSELASPKD